MDQQTFWRKCSTCKKPIPFRANYYECSVSTCTGLRTGYAFCSIPCWESHLPGARHRDAGAVEKQAGSTPYLEGAAGSAPAPARRIVPSPVNASSVQNSPQRQGGAQTPGKAPIPREVLIVVSKMKDYIRARSDMNTSGDVADVLSDIVRRFCDDAIDEARADGRKTVMERDFKRRP